MKRTRQSYVILAVSLLAVCAARGQAPTNGPGTTRSISLSECIDSGIRRNLGLVVQRFGPPKAITDFEVARAAFDPMFELRAGENASKQAASSSELEGSDQPTSKGRDASIAIRKKTSIGGEVGLSSDLNRSESDSSFATLNPAYDADFKLSVTQPLLKGAGSTVAEADLMRGRIAIGQASLAVRSAVLDEVRDTELAYWQWVLARDEREVRDASLRFAERLLEEAKARQSAGLSTRVDVLEAEAEQAAKMEAMIVADEAVADAEDKLRALAGFFGAALERIEPAESMPRPSARVPDVDVSIDRARRDQPEYLQQLEVIRQRELDVTVARNERKPALDLNADGGYLGRDGDSGGAYDQAASGNGYDWQVYLTLSAPWGFREEKARLLKSRFSLIEEQVRLARLDEDLFTGIRSACRAVVASHQRVEAAGKARMLRDKQREQEEARYKAGQVTVRDVLNVQQDLDDARLSELTALNDSLNAEVQLGRRDGSLLSRYGLDWGAVEDDFDMPVQARQISNGESK